MKFDNPPKLEKVITSDNYKEVIETPEFKSWFSGSVVIDDKDNPLVVYHSTNIKNFKGQNLKRNNKTKDWNSFGMFFSSDKNATRDFFTQDYMDSKERFDRLLKYNSDEMMDIQKDKQEFEEKYEPITKTFSCFLSIKNPLVLDNHLQLMDLSYSGVTFDLLKNSYDGIIIKHDSEFTDQYIVFHPEQIYILPSLIK